MIAVSSRTLESALAAAFRRLRSLRGSFAPASVKNAATARTFLTRLRVSGRVPRTTRDRLRRQSRNDAAGRHEDILKNPTDARSTESAGFAGGDPASLSSELFVNRANPTALAQRVYGLPSNLKHDQRKSMSMAKKRPQRRWVRRVKTDSTHPPPRTFAGSASQIARTMARKDVSPKGLGSAIRMIQAVKALTDEQRQQFDT